MSISAAGENSKPQDKKWREKNRSTGESVEMELLGRLLPGLTGKKKEGKTFPLPLSISAIFFSVQKGKNVVE